MPDKKLTDSEIVKALECCVNGECPNCPLSHNNTGVYNERCGENLMQNALDLINRLQAENKRLKAPTTDWLVRGISPEQLEQEKIQALMDIAKKYAKAEAYKEFAEKLDKASFITGYTTVFGGKDVPIKHITMANVHSVLKELVGADNA